ncbi:unnamed protein product [Echinostoma caproni]|uniref:Neur_chan_LBD domain-containing protein n=1 Tax=Echinostoma caproni TaxID=27848 RepID=A0A183A663_9TREM|nr:unnamed protein product [Echinostoma caproni]
MAIGLPNWWHSFVLLAFLISCSVRVQDSVAIIAERDHIEQLFPFGPLLPPPPPPPTAPPSLLPALQSPLQLPSPALPPPEPYSSFFNQTPPVPDYYVLPSNHDRSAYMPHIYPQLSYLTDPVHTPVGYDPSYSISRDTVDVFSGSSIPTISQSSDTSDTIMDYDGVQWEQFQPISPITSIIQHVLANYRSHESPDENNPDPTTVTVSVHILAVASINVVQMEYTVDLYLRQQWVDSRLAWAHVPHLAHFKDYVLLTAHKSRLWLPDLFFRNGKRGYKHKMSVPNDLIRVHPNGSVLYSQKITMILSCSMYLRLYPMDHQECQMNIGSYGYTVDELKFVWRDEDPVTVAENLQLLEFDSPRSASTRVSLSGIFYAVEFSWVIYLWKDS